MRRRSVLLSAVSGALTGALAVRRTTTAQEATPRAMANHPIVGAWLVMNPSDPANIRPAIFAADGTLTVGYVPSYTDAERGVILQGTAIGVWEPTGERGVHLTYVQALADPNGAYLGTLTRDAYPEVSADGQSFLDDGTRVRVTFRDATNTIVDEASGARAEAATLQVHARRMRAGVRVPSSASCLAGTLRAADREIRLSIDARRRCRTYSENQVPDKVAGRPGDVIDVMGRRATPRER